MAHSGVHLAASVVVDYFCWNCHDHLTTAKVEYYDKTRMAWLVNWGIEHLRQYKQAGNPLPGKSIHGGDSKAAEVLASTVHELTGNNGVLAGNNGVLANSNGVLVDTNAKQANQIGQLSEKLQQTQEEFAAYKANHPPLGHQQHAGVDLDSRVPVTPDPSRSVKQPRSTRSTSRGTTSARKPRKKKNIIADRWEDDEEVQVVSNYNIKKYAGKKGVVSLSSSTDSMVMVVFDDPKTSDKLIHPEGLISLCV